MYESPPVVSSRLGYARTAMASPWQELRSDFPALGRHVYLNAAAASPTPKPVREAVGNLYRELEEGGDVRVEADVVHVEDARRSAVTVARKASISSSDHRSTASSSTDAIGRRPCSAARASSESERAGMSPASGCGSLVVISGPMVPAPSSATPPAVGPTSYHTPTDEWFPHRNHRGCTESSRFVTIWL